VDLWACTQCASLNTRRSDKCYSCGLPRNPEESGPSYKRGASMYLLMGAAVIAIVAVTGIGAMTLFGLPTPATPGMPGTTAPPAIGAGSANPSVPAEPAASASASASATETPTAAASPPQTDRPTRSAGPETLEITAPKVVKSSNWAGYGLLGGEFVSVSGEWTQPEVDCSAGRETNASFWVGLDGATSDSVQQTGTSAECSAIDGIPTKYYAWYEMYPRPMRQAPLEVHPGDRFRARVHGLSAERFEMTLENLTTGQSFTTAEGRFGVWPTSVEWIVEPAAYCGPQSCVTSELARFADVTFTNIAAETISGPVTLQTATDKLVEFDLRAKRGAQLADVSALSADATSFDVTWVGATHRPPPSPTDR
jgi:Peptidase A4 family